MDFKQKYPVINRYLAPYTKRRPGQLISPKIKFVVAHDTGNPSSTALDNVSYYERTADETAASAHIFVDDKEIIECIPALTGNPEKAWHVRYEVSKDNQLYGVDANDCAIGVEYCYGPNINAAEAYKRYIWVIAYICHKFDLPPQTSIVGHFILDPGRKTDPINALSQSGRTYDKLLEDILLEYNTCRINLDKPMKLIKNPTSNKIYAIGNDNKKHWIFNEETFNIGRDMGLWKNWDSIEAVGDDSYAEGHAVILVK